MATDDVVLFTLGGTISMVGGAAGVIARLGGRELLAGLDGQAAVDVRDLTPVPSSSLSFSDILRVVDAAGAAANEGARGIVLTQGTDTLEETAFLIDSVWAHDAPFIVTGAMRNPTLPGPDGPANLVAAVQVAASATARDRGALVVFNDEIHAARHVRKTHSASTATFVSPDLGPLGHVVEGVPRFLAGVPRLPVVTGFENAEGGSTRVPLYTATLDDERDTIRRLVEGGHGLVVAGFGVGHVPGAFVETLAGLAQEMPVVLTSRAGAGPVFANTYGAPGSERDLLERGLISGGFLHPYKARVLLRLLTGIGADRDAIVAAFAAYA